jgi:hypothetical protein
MCWKVCYHAEVVSIIKDARCVLLFMRMHRGLIHVLRGPQAAEAAAA